MITPQLNVEKELAEKHNIAVAIVIAAVILGISIIVAAHCFDAERDSGMSQFSSLWNAIENWLAATRSGALLLHFRGSPEQADASLRVAANQYLGNATLCDQFKKYRFCTANPASATWAWIFCT